jgi:hypothetical protein
MFAGCWQIMSDYWQLIRAEGVGYLQLIRAGNRDVCRSCDLCLQAATGSGRFIPMLGKHKINGIAEFINGTV